MWGDTTEGETKRNQVLGDVLFRLLKPGLSQCLGQHIPLIVQKGPISHKPQTGPSQWQGPQSAHQVDKILVADLPIRMAVSESQEHLLFVRVQLGAVALQETAELAGADVARVPRIKLREKHR